MALACERATVSFLQCQHHRRRCKHCPYIHAQTPSIMLFGTIQSTLYWHLSQHLPTQFGTQCVHNTQPAAAQDRESHDSTA
jgi:hypothetical protein